MTAKEVLERMTVAYRESGRVDFERMFFDDVPSEIFDYLEANDYIVQKYDILGTVTLTEKGRQVFLT